MNQKIIFILLFLGLGLCGLAVMVLSSQGKKILSKFKNIKAQNEGRKLTIVKGGKSLELTYQEAIRRLKKGESIEELAKETGASVDELEALKSIIFKNK